jgi:uncharacterized protein YtpQ (UPF0354 family)
MKRFLSSLFGGRRTVLDSAAFSQKAAARFRKGFPKVAAVAVVRDLELQLTDDQGAKRSVFLNNSFASYLSAPGKIDEILGIYVRALAEPEPLSTRVDPGRIVPVVKDALWLTEAMTMARQRSNREPVPPVHEVLNELLIVLFAEDSPTRIRFLTEENLRASDLARETLRTLAVDNLRKLLPKVEVRPGGAFSLVTAGGNYEASLLLLDDLWSKRSIAADGDYVVAVPARDLLLVAASDSPANVARLREVASQMAAKAAYRLSDALFVYREGAFAVLPPTP